MLTRLTPLVIALSLGLSACTVSPTVSGVLPLPPVRIVQKSYSFLPPEQEGWVLLQRNAYQVQLARRIDDFDGTGSIQATLANLDYDGTPQGLLDSVRARTAAPANQSRFNTQNADYRVVLQAGQTCVRAEILTIDKQARTRDGGTTPMMLNMVQLICPLPENVMVGLSFSYSLRYRSLKPQSGIRVQAEQLMESIQFSQSPEPGLET